MKKLKTKYPQGAEKQLIYACCKRVVPEGKLPIDAGAVVVNVHTALSVFEAVFENKPSYERVMTVSGRAVAHPKNIWVKTGTLFRDVADFCGRGRYRRGEHRGGRPDDGGKRVFPQSVHGQILVVPFVSG